MSPKTPVPADNSELEEMLQERDTRLGDVMRAYIAEQTELIRQQLTEEMQATVGDMLKGEPAGGTGAYTPAAMAGPGVTSVMVTEAARLRSANSGLALDKVVLRNKLFSSEALGAPLDKLDYAASIGTFLQAIWHRAEAARPGDVENLRNFKRHHAAPDFGDD